MQVEYRRMLLASSFSFTATGEMNIPCFKYDWHFTMSTKMIGVVTWRAEMRNWNAPFCLAGLDIPYLIAQQSTALIVIPQFTAEASMTWWDLSIEGK